MTAAENALWQSLRRKNLGLKFYRQHPIYHDSSGLESFYIADFYCHSARLVVEVEGVSLDQQTDKKPLGIPPV
jgi:very-short-patch-repair endonuclease